MEGKKVSLKCICGKVVKGHSQKNAEANLFNHEHTSVFHKGVLNAIRQLKGKRV